MESFPQTVAGRLRRIGLRGTLMTMSQAEPFVVAVSEHDDVTEACRVIASSAGIDVLTADSTMSMPAGWRRAALLLLGLDAGAPEAATMPCIVVSREATARAWQHAADIGAEHVAVLPDAGTWLVQRMIAAVEPASLRAPVVGVVGGCGGAGASTLAAALARRSARDGYRPVLVDADRLGGGLDLVIGGEHWPGLRWPDLKSSRGPIRPAALAESLPTIEGVGLLSWDRRDDGEWGIDLFGSVVDAARTAFDLVVVDLPRHSDATVFAGCDYRFLVCPARVRAAVAAAQTARRLDAGTDKLIVRAPIRSGLTGPVLAENVGLPLHGVLKPDRGLSDALDRGDGVPASGRLNSLCATIVRTLEHGGSLGAAGPREEP